MRVVDKRRIAVYAGQSHLIFGTGSTGCVTISQFSKLCCVNAHYKPLEKLDAIALIMCPVHWTNAKVPLQGITREVLR